MQERGVSDRLIATLEKSTDLLRVHFPDKDKLLSLAEAADVIGCVVSTVFKWIESGKIPYIKKGARPFVRKSVADKVAELRAIHGSKWVDFTEWVPQTQPVETESHDENEVALIEEGAWNTFTKLVKKAKTLHKEGRFDAASTLFLEGFNLLEVEEI